MPPVLQRFIGHTILLLTEQRWLKTMLLTLEPSATIDRHRHNLREKSYFVVSGVCAVMFHQNGVVTKYSLEKGSCLGIPPGTVHSIENSTGETVIVVSTNAPFDDIVWLGEKPQPIE